LKDKFPQRLKPFDFVGSYGTAEAVPFQSEFELTHYAFPGTVVLDTVEW
jgi:hypothetical protein